MYLQKSKQKKNEIRHHWPPPPHVLLFQNYTEYISKQTELIS